MSYALCIRLILRTAVLPSELSSPCSTTASSSKAGVLVALLRALGELAGAVQQAADARDGVGAEQREAERLVHVPGELVRDQDAVDLGGVVVRVELRDPRRSVHAVHCRPPPAVAPATATGAT